MSTLTKRKLDINLALINKSWITYDTKSIFFISQSIVLVNGENGKISLMGIVHKSWIWVLKALWIFLFETINFRRKLHKTNIIGMPPRILP